MKSAHVPTPASAAALVFVGTLGTPVNTNPVKLYMWLRSAAHDAIAGDGALFHAARPRFRGLQCGQDVSAAWLLLHSAVLQGVRCRYFNPCTY